MISDKRGNLLMNADRTLVTEPHFINTHELVVSQDLNDCLGSCILLCFFFHSCFCVLSSMFDKFSLLFVFAGKMKYLHALVNEANKKVAAKKQRKNFQSLYHLIAGFGIGLTSGPMANLEGDGRPDELVQESVKRRKVETPSKEPTTPIRVVPLRSESGDFLQLPRVWSEPDRCGPHSTLFLDDPELWVIHDLGPAGPSKEIIE